MSLIMATCITPINLARTWGSIIFIFVVSTTKEAWDDYNRYIFDKQENDKNVWVVKKEIKTWIQVMSIHICDLAWLHENNEVTYDLVILGISKPQGLYYVKTVTLDGKSDLKTRTISP